MAPTRYIATDVQSVVAVIARQTMKSNEFMKISSQLHLLFLPAVLLGFI